MLIEKMLFPEPIRNTVSSVASGRAIGTTRVIAATRFAVTSVKPPIAPERNTAYGTGHARSRKAIGPLRAHTRRTPKSMATSPATKIGRVSRSSRCTQKTEVVGLGTRMTTAAAIAIKPSPTIQSTCRSWIGRARGSIRNRTTARMRAMTGTSARYARGVWSPSPRKRVVRE
jgi:hypothetical protein